MDLERITVALRPRTDFEAVDLGLRLAQSHYATALALWFCASAPWLILIAGIGIANDKLWLAVLAFWWIKPAFERVLLHLFSRVVFGDLPQRAEFLRIITHQPYRNGLFGALTWRRFEVSRSFNLPVIQLEQLAGRQRRRRSAVLQMGTNGTAAMLSYFSLGMVLLAFTTLAMLAVSFGIQEIMVFDPLSASEFVNALADRILVGGEKWAVLFIIVYWLCEGLIAPFYVAAGFCLYLNRRTHLEAWDVELQFRRLVRRRASAAALVGALIVGLLTLPAPTGYAQEPDPDRQRTRAQIQEILTDEQFGRSEERTRWVPKNSQDDDEDDRFLPTLRADGLFGEWFGAFSEIILWTVIALLAFMVFRLRDRWLPWLAGTRVSRRTAADAAGGLLLTDDEVPADIPARVRELWQQKKRRDAMSLLYRGALTVLNERHALNISSSDTEGECERRVLQKLDASSGHYFARIANHWQRFAYGHQTPTGEQVDTLCGQWHLIAATTDE